MPGESRADVYALSANIARTCLDRIASTNEGVPAKSRRSLEELVKGIDALARGDFDDDDAARLGSLGDHAIELSQSRSVEERALFDALGAAAYAADSVRSWETSLSPHEDEQSRANLLRAVRGACSVSEIAPSIVEVIGRDDVRLRVLAEALSSAVLASYDEVRRAHADERLLGFALCTDDSVTTLSAMACTEESLSASRAPAARWLPVEWPYADLARFDFVRDLLEASYRARGSQGFEVHVERAFAATVASLAILRAQRPVDDDVLIVSISTDPGPPFLEWAAAGADALNPAALAEEFRRAIGE